MSNPNALERPRSADESRQPLVVNLWGLNNFCISVPRKGAAAAVRTNGGATTGYICAQGTAQGGIPPAKAVAVYVKLYPANYDESMLPGTAVGVPGTIAATVYDDGTWAVDQIDNVACLYHCASPDQCPGGKLVGWAKFNDDTWMRDISNFTGVCSNQTDCADLTQIIQCPLQLVGEADRGKNDATCCENDKR